ncbi:MAG TPA: hypothetical protein ENK22_04445 [Persephonella sp.]|nr:hypothetical protein [Persephonella sp.]
MGKEKSKQLLRGYRAGLESFDIEEEEEANLILLYRQELEENKNFLSTKDREKLNEYDLKALELYEKYKNYNTEAVEWLKETAKLIEPIHGRERRLTKCTQ